MTGPVTVSVLLPILIEHQWQADITHCIINLLRTTTKVPFELVIVETKSNMFKSLADVYIHRPQLTNYVADANAGIEASTGAYVVQTANDIFVQPGWLEAMLEPFEKYPDCGVSTLASSDLPEPSCKKGDWIVEGVYGPHMMFKREWTFDTDYENIFSDSDMIMRIYEAGFRSYRNHKVLIHHLNRMTYDGLYSPEEQKERHDKNMQLFIQKHGKIGGHLRMFHYFVHGQIV